MHHSANVIDAAPQGLGISQTNLHAAASHGHLGAPLGSLGHQLPVEHGGQVHQTLSEHVCVGDHQLGSRRWRRGPDVSARPSTSGARCTATIFPVLPSSCVGDGPFRIPEWAYQDESGCGPHPTGRSVSS